MKASTRFKELTVEKIKAMRQDELLQWGEDFVKMMQAEEVSRVLIEYIEIRDAKKVVV